MFSNRVKEPEPARNLLRLPRLVVLLPSFGIYLIFLSIYQYIYLFRSGVIVKGGHCQPVTGGYGGALSGYRVSVTSLLSIYPSRIEVMMTCRYCAAVNLFPRNAERTFGIYLSIFIIIYLSIQEWSHDDLQLLIKAVNLFPAGTAERWAVCAEFVNQHTANKVNCRFILN